ncbi:ABC transporter substrate-binding protein [Dethiosulfatarculus sandiegensis]|uniref:ABC transporter substrate-binding protein n=1 Tax=Dethiosulfatarculus sandiegensis TaxID=1429043 RepID=UPI0005C88C36|nr:ABC transporter substrate-binding protein [Dethiosulfatarculus sandiegensis]
MRRFIFGFVLAVLLAAFVLPGLTAPALALDELRISDGKGDWGYPNPYNHYPRGPGYLRMALVYDTLIWKDKNGYIPALADKWSFLPQEQAFSFELNPKAKWHDGKPVTAEDVAFTISYFRKHPYPWVSVANLGEVKVLGPHKLKIPLKKPYAPFISDIGGTMPVLPKHVWEKVKDPKAYRGPGAFTGSGPYLFKDFNKAKGSYLFEAFDGYYLGKPKVERLIFVKGKNPIMALTTKAASFSSIKPDMAPILEKKGFVVLKGGRGWNKKLMINHRIAPFNDRRFRRALVHAINRQEIIDKAHRGLGTVASLGLLSKDHPMYNPDTPDYAYDPAKAEEILKSLGYSKDKDGFFAKDGKPLELTLLASNITVAGERVPDRDGEIIKLQLGKVGIKVKLINLEQGTTDAKVKNWDFQLAVSGHGGIMGDPKILNELIYSKIGAGSVNCARFDDNKELNRLLDESLDCMDPAKRKKMVQEIQRIYAEELPAISLFYPENVCAYDASKGVEWYFTPGGISKGIPIAQNKMSLIR